MLIFTIWSQRAHGNLRNWAEDHGLDSMAEERPFAKNCAEKNMELLERSEVSQGEIDYYMELYIYGIRIVLLEIYWCSKPLSADSLISHYTALYLLKGFSSSIVRVPTVTAQLYTAKVELRSLRCKT